LLGETKGYLPDPKTAKSIIEVLGKLLEIAVDLKVLDKEIEKSNQILGRMQDIEKRRAKYIQNIKKVEEEKITYIS